MKLARVTVGLRGRPVPEAIGGGPEGRRSPARVEPRDAVGRPVPCSRTRKGGRRAWLRPYRPPEIGEGPADPGWHPGWAPGGLPGRRISAVIMCAIPPFVALTQET